MTESSTFDFWGFATPWIQGVFFFILGVTATIVVERRRSLRTDHEIWVWETSKSLAKPSLGQSEKHLKYVVDDRTVTNPYELDLSVWANGRKDIPPTLFNGEARIELGVPIVAILRHQEHGDEEAEIEVAETSICLRPSVIRRDVALRWVMLTDGRPTIKFVGEPLDTEFYNWGDLFRGPRPIKTWARVAGTAALVGAFAILIWFLVYLRAEGIDPIGTPFQIIPFIFSGLLVGGMVTLMASSSLYGSRLRLARRTLHSRPLKDLGGEGEVV